MCQLLETIKLENGVLFNMQYHNRRFNDARRELFSTSEIIELEHCITIPEQAHEGLFRCRITYSREIHSIEFIAHTPRPIKSLKLVTDNEIDYAYKYADRQQLNMLLSLKEDCDEIIIVKNGKLTDCSIGNLAFLDGAKWWTPDTPLLNGTKRSMLLEQGLISEKEIKVNDIRSFQKVAVINVFHDLDETTAIPVSSIH